MGGCFLGPWKAEGLLRASGPDFFPHQEEEEVLLMLCLAYEPEEFIAQKFSFDGLNRPIRERAWIVCVSFL